LFPALKRELAGLTMTKDEFRPKWERVIRTLSKDDFPKAFQRWLESVFQINGYYVEKS
jgi:hypothetical protein